MSAHPRDEVEAAFRHYFQVGPVEEDWVAWSQLFTDDAVYSDHYWGKFHGPEEIQQFLESTMSMAPGVYTVMEWYVIDGDRVVWKGINRADNPEAGGEPFGFPSLQLLTYAGDGKWSSEEDWWIAYEMQRFGKEYFEACATHDPEHPQRMTRLDWGTAVDWARPAAGHEARPSWLGRDDVTPIATARQMTFGERNPR
jgi:ketosteroid isomerase-like protein